LRTGFDPISRSSPRRSGLAFHLYCFSPLIENAIKYAVTPSEEGADIWINATQEGQAVRLEVADNGKGDGSALSASPSTGVGLANIRDRLAQAYGAAHGFSTRQNDQGGFSVVIEFPTKPEKPTHDHPHRARR
jgi:LytS/YehU family sensor histidine kinase